MAGQASTNTIYLSMAREIVHAAVVKGYNGCVLAYGQVGYRTALASLLPRLASDL